MESCILPVSLGPDTLLEEEAKACACALCVRKLGPILL